MGTPVIITALKPQEHHPERVNVFVDGEFRCGLALELALGGGLRVGEDVGEETLRSLVRRDLLWKARDAALHLLGYRARTEAELRRRLLRKEFPEDVVEECVADLVDRGFVDDAQFAAAFVRDRVRARPRGTRRLVQELRARGVAGETAGQVVEETLENEAVSELELAREAAEAWARRAFSGRADHGRPEGDPWEVRRRLFGYLTRRGFGVEVIRAVMDEVLASRRD